MDLNLLTTKNDELFNKLEWNYICEILANKAYFLQIKEKLSRPDSLLRKFEIQTHLAQLDDFIELTLNNYHHQFYELIKYIPSDSDLVELNKQIEKGSILSLKKLNTFANLIEAMKGNYFLELSEDDKKAVKSLAREFVKPIRTFVSKEGKIDYYKHPLLHKYYEQLNKLERAIRSKIKKLKDSPEISSALQFEGQDIINDMFVIAIKSDHYRHSFGHIIERSETGNTFYIQPFSVLEESNKRLQLQAEIDECINRIEIEHSRDIEKYTYFINNFINIIYLYDELLAKSQFCIAHNLCKPNIESAKNIFRAKALFHPLLNDPVTNDISIDSQNKGVLISGPNTGGKTVLLKSIILCQLFLRKGLYAPAQELSLSIYDGIYYFGNDDQNLKSGLSSFSSEVSNYLNLLEQLKETNLIIIDEIFNTTSSEQASALAISLFEQLTINHQSQVMASTHHHSLKHYIQSNPSFISCHMSFDSKNLKPSYKLVLGAPGSSMAMEVIEGIWHSSSQAKILTKRAKELLDSNVSNYDKLLLELSSKKEELNQLIHENNQIKAELQKQEKSSKATLELRTQKALEKKTKELKDLVKHAEVILKEHQRNPTKKNIKKIEQIYEEVSPNKDLFHHSIKERQTTKKATEHSLSLEKTYYCHSIRDFVKLVSLNQKKKTAKVQTKNNITIEVPQSELENRKKGSQKQDAKVQFTFSHDEDLKVQIDCRGMRLEQFKHTVSKHHAYLLSGEIPFINIIHGHGDAILKSWLKEYIKKESSIKADLQENGNDGETKIVLS